MDYPLILDRVHAAVKPVIGSGKVASCVSELAKVPPHQCGIAVVDLNSRVLRDEDADTLFSLQSIFKRFALTLAFHRKEDSVWARLGCEPWGALFNSLVQLEHERGKPRNPFINAGAMVITDMLLPPYAAQGGATNVLIPFIRRLFNSRRSNTTAPSRNPSSTPHIATRRRPAS